MFLRNSRIIQFDVLRVVAAFAVVLLHVSAQRIYECYPSSEWDTRNLYNAFTRWCVPVFVMISGALFLDSAKKINIKTLYKKNIFRLVLVFIFWTIIYGAYAGIKEHDTAKLIGKIIRGPYHFWFLRMLVGMYICVPLLRAITANKKLEKYFLYLSLITAFIIPMFFPLIGHFSDMARDFAENLYEDFSIKIALGFAGYFVLGHFLMHNFIEKNTKTLIVVLGIMSFVTICVITSLASNIAGEPYLLLYEYVNVFVLLEAIAVFVVIKNLTIAPKYHGIIIRASKLSLGVYIVHPLVMKIANDFCGINSASLNPAYFIPLFALLVFTVSYLLVSVLVRTPIIKRFML